MDGLIHNAGRPRSTVSLNVTFGDQSEYNPFRKKNVKKHPHPNSESARTSAASSLNDETLNEILVLLKVNVYCQGLVGPLACWRGKHGSVLNLLEL